MKTVPMPRKTQSHRRPGRPSKGPRRGVFVKVPEPLAEALDEGAGSWSVKNDYLTWVLANGIGRTDLVPGVQEGLPIRDSA